MALMKVGVYIIHLNIAKFSDVHIRNKRVVDRAGIGHSLSSLQDVPYIVNILKNGTRHCGGSILDSTVILTAAHCIFSDDWIYTVLSNSVLVDRGIPHKVIRKIEHPEYNFLQVSNDIALLIIFPPINVHTSRNGRIKLFNGQLPPNSEGIISGWGCHLVYGVIKEYPRILRSITVSIIDSITCHRIHHNDPEITDRCICSYYSNRNRFCCDGDSGGPLAFNNKLVGVMAWSKDYSHSRYPDVFMNLLHHVYRNWIISYVPQAE